MHGDGKRREQMIEFFTGLTVSKLWLAIIFTSAVKYLLSPSSPWKQNVGGMLAGGVCAYFGHTFILNHIGFLSGPEDDIVVVIMLCLCGEHIMRSIMQATPEKILGTILKKFK